MTVAFKSKRAFIVAAAVVVVLGLAWADREGVGAALQSPDQRKPAPEFALKGSSGKSVHLGDYRGKVVLLDFWATWCHGCKEEIPWFADFSRRYSQQGLTVVGISMDDDGWKVVTPFVKSVGIPYLIVLGDAATAKAYSIQSMPDTFLIDRNGRIAATYNGVVDKDDLDRNIQASLKER